MHKLLLAASRSSKTKAYFLPTAYSPSTEGPKGAPSSERGLSPTCSAKVGGKSTMHKHTGWGRGELARRFPNFPMTSAAHKPTRPGRTPDLAEPYPQCSHSRRAASTPPQTQGSRDRVLFKQRRPAERDRTGCALAQNQPRSWVPRVLRGWPIRFKTTFPRGTWVAQQVKYPALAQVVISPFRSSSTAALPRSPHPGPRQTMGCLWSAQSQL